MRRIDWGAKNVFYTIKSSIKKNNNKKKIPIAYKIIKLTYVWDNAIIHIFNKHHRVLKILNKRVGSNKNNLM